MKEKRRYERRPDSLQMSIKPVAGETGKTLITRDVSDGGIFLLAMGGEQLAVGTEVVITPAHYTDGITPPAIKGRVIRVSDQGMGIEFLEPSFS